MFLRYFLILATALNVASISSFAVSTAKAISINKGDLLDALTPDKLEKTTLNCDQNRKVIVRIKDMGQVDRTVELWMVGFKDSLTLGQVINNVPDEIIGCKVMVGTCKQAFKQSGITLWLNVPLKG